MEISQMFENEVWIEETFGNTDLGDKRLNDRLLTVASKMSERPGSSIPQQMGSWHDTKACYSFLNNGKVKPKLIQDAHRKRVKSEASGKTTLFIQDTSEADYSNLEATEDLGFIGNHNNQGLMFHSCLAVVPDAKNPKVLGLAHQQVWTRSHPSLNKNETRSERNKRKKESDIWLENLKAIGRPPEETTWVSIGDRGNDIFTFFVGTKELGWECLVRVSQDRCIEANGEETSVMAYVRSLEEMGNKVVSLRKANETKSRDITCKVSYGKVELQPPTRLNGNVDGVTVSIVRCWNDEEEIEWILYSSILVESMQDAIEKIEWYSNRWIIEEYHKCLKTGCRIESSQLETAKGLKTLLAVLGIIAILMLQLRNVSRDNPDEPASKTVDERALKIISKRFKMPLDISARQFWHSVARLGGFLARKSDGEPGWQTLWTGWLRLLDMMWGHECIV